MAHIKFRVQDPAGVGLALATIALTKTTQTASDGWVTDTIPAGDYTGTISAPGFVTRTIPWRFANDGTVLVGLDPDHGPPPPVPHADAIDVGAAIVTRESPDVRDWPIGTRITEFAIQADGTIAINFDKRDGPDAWPLVKGPETPNPGDDGLIQYTLGVGCCINEIWRLCTAMLCVKRPGVDNYVTGGNILESRKFARDWYYYAGEPLASYAPRRGELLAWFVAAGALRRGDVHTIAARSNVILAPLQVGKFV